MKKVLKMCRYFKLEKENHANELLYNLGPDFAVLNEDRLN